MPRPQAKTIRQVIDHLAEYGFEVSNQLVDLETGQEFPSLGNYDADEIIKLRRLYDKDLTWSMDDRS